MHIDSIIDELLDGNEDPALRRRIDDHLAGCAECRAAFTAVLRGHDALRLHPRTDAPISEDAALGMARTAARARAPYRPARAFAAGFAAALATVFVAGALWLQLAQNPADTANDPRFMFILTGADVSRIDPSEMQRVGADFRAWTDDLRSANRIESTGQLSRSDVALVRTDATVTTPSAQQLAALQGYYVVTAADLEAAVALARTSPYLRMNGDIVVRKIGR